MSFVWYYEVHLLDNNNNNNNNNNGQLKITYFKSEVQELRLGTPES